MNFLILEKLLNVKCLLILVLSFVLVVANALVRHVSKDVGLQLLEENQILWGARDVQAVLLDNSDLVQTLCFKLKLQAALVLLDLLSPYIKSALALQDIDVSERCSDLIDLALESLSNKFQFLFDKHLF